MVDFRMLLLSLQIAFSSMATFAYSCTFLNTPVEEFRVYLNESYEYQLTVSEYDSLWNLIQNIWMVGFLIGMFLSPLMNDRYGRKGKCNFIKFIYPTSSAELANRISLGLLSGTICNLLMSIVQWAAVQYYAPSLLLIGRFISSIATAITFQSSVLYLQEFPPSAKRGTCSYTSDIAYSFFCFTGMTLGTNQLLGDNLSLLMAVLIGICTISVLFTLRIHESPKYLLIKMKDRYEFFLTNCYIPIAINASLASIQFFHGSDSSESSLKFLEELVEEGREDEAPALSFKDISIIFADPALRKTVLLGVAAVEMCIPLWTLLFNSTDLLLDLNASKFIAQWTSSGMVVCYFLGVSIGMFLVDRIGRRALLIPCSGASIFCIAAFTSAFYLQTIIPHAEWIAVGAMLANGLVFGMGITTIGWFIAPELSPQRYRSLIQSIVAVLNTIQSATFTFAVMPLYRVFGPWIFLVLFCLVCTICNVYLYFELPETKGRSISEITECVRNGTKRPKARNNV